MSGADWAELRRLGGLRRFAIAISILNVLGHTVFGFEQAWATPFVALAAAYGTELVLEWVDARVSHRPARFAGGLGTLVNFLLPAHITDPSNFGISLTLLLYPWIGIAPSYHSPRIWQAWALGFFRASSCAAALF